MIKSSSVFVVSGGAKGITAQCAIELAQQNPCNFILLGRSPVGASEPDWAKDCFDESELKKRIKVKGLENLLSCVNPSQLDHLVLFSSVTGFYGNVGQTDYAIANEILNKSAHLVKQNYPSCHVVAINWGPWESGMVTPQLKKALAERNMEIIPVDVGAKILVNELDAANHETAQIVVGSPVLPEFSPSLGELSSELRTYRIRRKLTLEANLFLLDHEIVGRPVLPAMCSIGWTVNACEQLYPNYKFFNCTNMKVLKGIVFDETLAIEYILELEETTKNSQEIELYSKIWSKTKAGKVLYNYSCQVKLVRQLPSAPKITHNYESLNVSPDHIIPDSTSSTSFYQNGGATLFHGPCFHGVTEVLNITPDKITTQCIWKGISPEQQGQFPVQTFNPYTADIETHAVWIWLQHFHQAACLPASQEKFEHFADIPLGEPFYVSCEIKSKTATSVIVDIITHNLEGQIYSRLLGAKGTIFPLDQAKHLKTAK